MLSVPYCKVSFRDASLSRCATKTSHLLKCGFKYFNSASRFSSDNAPKFRKNTFCSHCGTKFPDGKLSCISCGNVTYVNPIPVVVGIMRLANTRKVIIIKRGIPPHIGGAALVGGYLDAKEEWKSGLCREVREEIGLDVSPNWSLLNVHSLKPPANEIIIFASQVIPYSEIAIKDQIKLSNEVLSYELVESPVQLCFSTHQEELDRYYSTLTFPPLD